MSDEVTEKGDKNLEDSPRDEKLNDEDGGATGSEICNDSNGDESEDESDSEVDSDENGDDLTLEQALEKLDAAQQTIVEQQDEVLRVKAEMQNIRRRSEQDVEKAHKYGQERFSIELLAVMDNLERALQSVKDSDDEPTKASVEGMELTLKSFEDCFKKFKIEAVDPLGEPCDPQLHQAMSMQENEDVEPNTVIAVMQKGYTLHGRVIRPAMVLVSKSSSPTIDEKA